MQNAISIHISIHEFLRSERAFFVGKFLITVPSRDRVCSGILSLAERGVNPGPKSAPKLMTRVSEKTQEANSQAPQYA